MCKTQILVHSFQIPRSAEVVHRRVQGVSGADAPTAAAGRRAQFDGTARHVPPQSDARQTHRQQEVRAATAVVWEPSLQV